MIKATRTGPDVLLELAELPDDEFMAVVYRHCAGLLDPVDDQTLEREYILSTQLYKVEGAPEPCVSKVCQTCQTSTG